MTSEYTEEEMPAACKQRHKQNSSSVCQKGNVIAFRSAHEAQHPVIVQIQPVGLTCSNLTFMEK